MKVDAYSSMPHYADHIRPVWEALPAEVRGTWYTPVHSVRGPVRGPMIVASFRDAEAVGRRPLIYVEHGAGQTYADAGPAASSYSGGPGLDQVVLFICPSERVADRWRVRYAAPAAAVGCPKLDRWHGYAGRGSVLGSGGVGTKGRMTLDGVTGKTPAGGRGDVTSARASRQDTPSAPGGAPTVAVTFHSDLAVCPETRSAWSHYDAALPALCSDPRWRILGHGHPRLWATIAHRWRKLGVDHTPYADDVLGQADVLVADNTSLMYEAAAVGIPVVALNAPWFRRDVEHGLRFWSHVPGVQVDHPHQLVPSIVLALADPWPYQDMRATAVAEAYAAVDGRAAQRAATAILEVL